MARARKSHDNGKEKTKSPAPKLKPPYADKVGGNKFVVYADLSREGDPYARVLILNFAAEYAARYFIDLLVKGDTWAECDPVGSREGFITASDIRITMFGKVLWELMDYKVTEEERLWEDESVKQSVLRFKYGIHEAAKKNDYEEQQDGTLETLSDNGTKRETKRREPRSPKEPKVKVDKSGYISANNIAAELRVEGREVRGALRASGMTKPNIGWMWLEGSAELKEARKTIEANLKKKAKK